jgi:hypothetical protein
MKYRYDGGTKEEEEIALAAMTVYCKVCNRCGGNLDGLCPKEVSIRMLSEEPAFEIVKNDGGKEMKVGVYMLLETEHDEVNVAELLMDFIEKSKAKTTVLKCIANSVEYEEGKFRKEW